MKVFSVVIPILLIGILFGSCNREEEQGTHTGNTTAKSKESLVVVNRYLTRTEEEDIKYYIERHDLKVVETGSGLRYSIVKQGDG